MKRQEKKIFTKVEEFLGREPKLVIGNFVKTLPSELTSLVDRLYLFDLSEVSQDRKLLDKELKKIIVEIKKISLKEKLLVLSGKLKDTKEKEAEEICQEYRKAAAELKKYQSI